MFKTIARHSTLTERTQLQVEELITSGVLKAGDRLPSERDLSEKFAVSKTVVREAMRSLAAKGLLEVRPGSGMYVRQVGSDIMTQPMTLLLRLQLVGVDDVIELRSLLEPRIASLAAERAQPSDIETMEESISALRSPTLTAEEYAEADLAFHDRLAAASHTPLLTLLANSINELMLEVRLRAFALEGPRVAELAVHLHTAILDRVKARDVEGSRRAMEEHLEQAADTLRRAHASLNNLSLEPRGRWSPRLETPSDTVKRSM